MRSAVGTQSPVSKTKETVRQNRTVSSMRCRRRPTLPRSLERSTIGAAGLNDRVRNGNGCGPCASVASENRLSKIESWGGRTRTCNFRINSPAVCQLTYTPVGTGPGQHNTDFGNKDLKNDFG